MVCLRVSVCVCVCVGLCVCVCVCTYTCNYVCVVVCASPCLLKLIGVKNHGGCKRYEHFLNRAMFQLRAEQQPPTTYVMITGVLGCIPQLDTRHKTFHKAAPRLHVSRCRTVGPTKPCVCHNQVL